MLFKVNDLRLPRWAVEPRLDSFLRSKKLRHLEEGVAQHLLQPSNACHGDYRLLPQAIRILRFADFFNYRLRVIAQCG